MEGMVTSPTHIPLPGMTDDELQQSNNDIVAKLRALRMKMQTVFRISRLLVSRKRYKRARAALFPLLPFHSSHFVTEARLVWRVVIPDQLTKRSRTAACAIRVPNGI